MGGAMDLVGAGGSRVIVLMTHTSKVILILESSWDVTNLI